MIEDDWYKNYDYNDNIWDDNIHKNVMMICEKGSTMPLSTNDDHNGNIWDDDIHKNVMMIREKGWTMPLSTKQRIP